MNEKSRLESRSGEEIPTPRTDRARESANMAPIVTGHWVPADFARELERELAAMTAARDYEKEAHARTRAYYAGKVTPASENRTHPDTARLDHLAEITNLSALHEMGSMLTGEQARRIDKTATALSSRYELHRRTHDTPEAFRLAVDDAIKECK